MTRCVKYIVTVRIVPARFRDFGELREFVRYVERSFDPEKVALDAPHMMELRERTPRVKSQRR